MIRNLQGTGEIQGIHAEEGLSVHNVTVIAYVNVKITFCSNVHKVLNAIRGQSNCLYHSNPSFLSRRNNQLRITIILNNRAQK